MSTNVRSEHFSCLSEGEQQTLTTEDPSFNGEVGDSGSSVACGILPCVILGQPVEDFDLYHFNVYICGFKAYQAIQNYVPGASVLQTGEATSYLFAERRWHYVVELHKNVRSSAHTSSVLEVSRKTMW